MGKSAEPRGVECDGCQGVPKRFPFGTVCRKDKLLERPVLTSARDWSRSTLACIDLPAGVSYAPKDWQSRGRGQAQRNERDKSRRRIIADSSWEAQMGARFHSQTPRQLARARRWARRRIIVNPAYQLRSLLPVAVFMTIYAVLLVGLAFYPLHRAVNAEPDPGIQALLAEQLLSLHVRMWPLLGMAALVAGTFALVRSHRVAGPLYRLNKTLNELVQGEVKKDVRFREGDEFREFESLTNQLAKKMQLLSTRHRDVLLTMQGRVKNLSVRLAKEDVPKTEACQALDDILTQLSKVLSLAPPG